MTDSIVARDGIEPPNRLWRALRLATDGDENGLYGGILREPQTMEADGVWQCEAAAEYGPGRVGTEE